MALKVIFCILCISLMCGAYLWCHRKCVCQEQNLKLICRDVTPKDIFKYTALTKEIELRKSYIDMKWLTKKFKKLELVTIIEPSIVIDCEISYDVNIKGACEGVKVSKDRLESSTTGSTHFPIEIFAKGLTPRSAKKLIEKQKFNIIIGSVAVCSIICSAVLLLVGKKIIQTKVIRMREQRMAQMIAEMGFEPNNNKRNQRPEPSASGEILMEDPDVTEVKTIEGKHQ